jgi:hypothetical protein
VAKTGAIKGALVAVIRGAILPYFGKRGIYWAYFPQEEERTVLQAFPVLARRYGQEKEPI